MRAVAPRWMPVVRDYELPVREVDPEFALMLYVSNWYRNAAAAAALSFWVFLPIGVVLGATGATETDWVAWVVGVCFFTPVAVLLGAVVVHVGWGIRARRRLSREMHRRASTEPSGAALPTIATALIVEAEMAKPRWRRGRGPLSGASAPCLIVLFTGFDGIYTPWR